MRRQRPNLTLGRRCRVAYPDTNIPFWTRKPAPVPLPNHRPSPRMLLAIFLRESLCCTCSGGLSTRVQPATQRVPHILGQLSHFVNRVSCLCHCRSLRRGKQLDPESSFSLVTRLSLWRCQHSICSKIENRQIPTPSHATTSAGRNDADGTGSPTRQRP